MNIDYIFSSNFIRILYPINKYIKMSCLRIINYTFWQMLMNIIRIFVVFLFFYKI